MEDVGEREVSSRVGEGGGCESRGILAAGGGGEGLRMVVTMCVKMSE